jgi:hypothetical protein
MQTTRPQISEVRTLLKRMLDEGNMTREHYLKCVISLAYEAAVDGDLATAKSFLGECDDAYLRDTLPQQMRDDANFCEVAVFVAERLSESGISHESQDDRLLESLGGVGKA